MQALILRCPYCGSLMVAKRSFKVRTCSFCGRRFKVSSKVTVGEASTVREASELIREIKKEIFKGSLRR